ncbi:hypothetical protein GCM10027082_47810 [Comamonas humi]
MGETPAAFGFTGGEQTVTVPAGVHSLTVYLSGAQGGAGRSGAGTIGGSPNSPGGTGGLGGRVRGTLAVTPGSSLSIWVGGQASQAVNPGGVGQGVDGIGGGATDLRVGGNTPGNRVAIAGGGGGGGNAGWSTANVIAGGAGGVGGGGTGGAGANVPGGPGPFGGGGGAVGTGGAAGGGCGSFPATAGNAANGDGGDSFNFSGSFSGAGFGGGGGGGATVGAGGGGAGVGTTSCQQNWNGGGGGGAGGSSGATGLTAVTINNGVQAGNGAALICFAPSEFAVGGTATGQTGPVTLQLTASNPASTQQVVVAQAASSYVFATRLPVGANWAVSVLSAPAGQLCTVSAASGTAIAADVSNVALSCTTVAITVAPAAIPGGTYFTLYSQLFTASSVNGGVAPYTFSTPPGVLPAGLSLSSAGVLSGTPTAVGTFNFSVQATSNNGFSGSRPYTLTIGKAGQAITSFAAVPAAPTFSQGGTFNVSAAGGASGLPVVFSIAASSASVCTAGGLNGSTIAMLSSGTCSVLANQAGNGNYEAAAQVPLNVPIGKAPQTISAIVVTPTSPVFSASGTFSVAATGGPSGLPVTFSIAPSSAGICSSGGTNGSTITMLASGTCSVLANQAGNGNYQAAAQVSLNVAIGKAPQTISAITATPTSPVFSENGTFSVAATGGPSGLPVTFSIAPSSAGICSSSGTNGSTITMLATGICTIQANQAGNTNYEAAPQVQQNVSIAKGVQVISFTSTSPAEAKVGGTYTVAATGGASGNTVVFTVDGASASICTISESTVTFEAVGTCTINANQQGNANYSDAPQAQQMVSIGQGNSGVTITSSVNPSFPSQSVTFTVSVTLEVPPSMALRTKVIAMPTGDVEITDGGTSLGSATLVDGVASITTTQLKTLGEHSLVASYGGDANYPATTSTVYTQTVIAREVKPIPTLSQWALMLLSFTVAGFAAAGLRRSRVS